MYLRQYRIILSADTASEVRQMLSPVSYTHLWGSILRGLWPLAAALVLRKGLAALLCACLLYTSRCV